MNKIEFNRARKAHTKPTGEVIVCTKAMPISSETRTVLVLEENTSKYRYYSRSKNTLVCKVNIADQKKKQAYNRINKMLGGG